MKIRGWIAIPLTAGLAFGGWTLWKARVKAAERERYEERTRIVIEGKVAKLDGPILKDGNPSDLKFEKVDLGIGEIVSVSEDGDVLYKWYGDQPLRKNEKDVDGFERTYLSLPPPIYRVRTRNGVYRTIENENKVQMSRSGAIYTILRNSDSPTKILKDGKILYEGLRSGPSSELDWNYGARITDDLVTNSNHSPYRFQFVNGKTERHDLQKPTSTNIIAESSSLGTFIRDNPTESWGHTSRITLLKNGIEQRIEAPISEYGMVSSKTALYLNPSFGRSTNVLKYEEGRFEQIAHPNDSVYFEVTSANSKHDMLANSHSLDAKRLKSKLLFPYRVEHLYISDGRSYSLSAHLDVSGLGIKQIEWPSYRSFICEDGSFVIEYADHDFKHVLLLRRLK